MTGPAVKPAAPAKKEIERVLGVERGETYVVTYKDGTTDRLTRKAYNKLVRPRVADED